MASERRVARQFRQFAAFAIARVLVVDPVVGVDAVGRDVVAGAKYPHQNAPCRDLRRGGGRGDIRIIAGELNPDRIVADHLTERRLVVDVFVVVAVGTVAMGRDEGFRRRPIHRPIGLDPNRDAAPGRVIRLRARAVARRSGRSLGLVHDDVAPRRLPVIAPRREPDDLEPGNLRRARTTRDRRQIRRWRLRLCLSQRQQRRGQQRQSDQAVNHRRQWVTDGSLASGLDQAVLRHGSNAGGGGSGASSWTA
ncbi:hypothetical protein RPD_1476 [Rhodopseudomonas palustris BisB5]|uniref:Uncharacterized protein n=1 Tax=Rhodopseudomonas palustris (strain BisB5) TaxID=316057 RepID=Q13B26_RHOPS|nr:hypothetical protein RPD_1476 [Rhodopseudomonas palustris BisB5]